jgi:hypothetical protein
VRKRAIPDAEIVTNEGQDALLMLVSAEWDDCETKLPVLLVFETLNHYIAHLPASREHLGHWQFRLTIVPFYSLGASLYTIFALLFALLVSPFRLAE